MLMYVCNDIMYVNENIFKKKKANNRAKKYYFKKTIAIRCNI